MATDRVAVRLARLANRTARCEHTSTLARRAAERNWAYNTYTKRRGRSDGRCLGTMLSYLGTRGHGGLEARAAVGGGGRWGARCADAALRDALARKISEAATAR